MTVALVLLLSACGAEPSPAAPADAERGVPEPVWLDAGAGLYDAQEAWGMPLPVPFAFETLVGLELDALCQPNHLPNQGVFGCTLFDPPRVLVRAGLTAAELERTRLHEYGHALLGDGVPNGGHLGELDGCPADVDGLAVRGEHVMCSHARERAELTPEDFDFVWNAATWPGFRLHPAYLFRDVSEPLPAAHLTP